MPIRVVAFDGDDTLWHNETHFNFTQAALRHLLRGHAPNADVDARLFETEMANLSLYGYGIKSFTLSMIETALEITDGTIPASDLKVILDWGKRMLREPTELLEGVRETLLGMSQNHQLLLITKGDLFDQESKLARSGLAERFAGVEILSDKNVDSYRRVLGRRGIDAGEFVMVGNSLRSDVVPVVELGARAVHIPYHVTWQHEQVDEDSVPGEGWFRHDKSFNHLAYVGLQKAIADFHVKGDVTESKTGDDYVPNLTSYASKNYDLVIGVGFLMQEAVGKVSGSFPNVHFAIIDGAGTDASGKDLQHSNVESLFFKEQDAGAMVGVIAGMLEKDKKAPGNTNVISAVGGVSIPPV